MEFLLSVLANVLGTVVGGVIAFFLVERWIKRLVASRDQIREEAQREIRARTQRDQRAIASAVDAATTAESRQALAEILRQAADENVDMEDLWPTLSSEHQSELIDAAGEQWTDDEIDRRLGR